MTRESFACSIWYYGIGILGGDLVNIFSVVENKTERGNLQ